MKALDKQGAIIMVTATDSHAKENAITAISSRMNAEVAERKRIERQIKKLNGELEELVSKRSRLLTGFLEENSFKVRELTALNRLSNLNLSKIRLDRLCSIILDALVSGSPHFFDRAMLFLLNRRTDTLQGMIAVTHDPLGITPDYENAPTDLNLVIRGAKLPVGGKGSLFHYVISRKRTLSLHPERHVSDEAMNLFAKLNIEKGAVMPLLGKDGVIGIILVDNYLSLQPLSRQTLKFLQLFSSHAGIAVENLMLYTKVEDTNRCLKETQEQLVHGERLATIGEMAASIAHELKGPMVAIGGLARRLAKRLPQKSAESGYATTIVEEVDRLESMLGDVLSFSKKSTICYEHFSICELLDSVMLLIEHILGKSRIAVSKSYPKRDLLLYADPQQLKQVFLNIIYNAIDAMREGGTIKITVSPAKIEGNRAVAVKIADCGGGIPPSMMARVFTPFFTTKGSGTGLGLPIANRLVTNHGGKITIKNITGAEEPSGAEFTVTLPCME